MAETYCGKSCAECAHKEGLNCPGCKTGPGRTFGGDCELARCVRNKSHETCDTCVSRGNCGTLQGRDSMPAYRRRRIEAEAQRRAAIAERAPVLGKWLWILFWLIVPSEIAGLMTNDTVAGMLPVLYIPGLVLETAVHAAYGIILLRLTALDERYRTAGSCALLTGGASFLTACLSGGGEAPPWTLVISLPAAILAFAGKYSECMAHSSVLTGVDNELAEKWEKLWKWTLGLYGGVVGSMIVMIFIPLLGVLAILAAAIGLVALSIMKLVYLYRTAKIFRAYPSAA